MTTTRMSELAKPFVKLGLRAEKQKPCQILRLLTSLSTFLKKGAWQYKTEMVMKYIIMNFVSCALFVFQF